MILTTTPSVEGKRITQYLGVVTGETIVGAIIFKDIMAGIRAIVGIDIDTETVGSQGAMLLVSLSGTAVTIQ